MDGRGRGPARNTRRRWSWLRSDKEYCESRVVIKPGRQRRRGRQGRRGGGGKENEAGGGGGRGRGGN